MAGVTAGGAITGLGIEGLNSISMPPEFPLQEWRETMRHVVRRAQEISRQRSGVLAVDTRTFDLRRYEYEQFYAGWVGLAFRFRACAGHNDAYTALFARTHGVTANEDLYQEDAALFGFFLSGLSALECLAYALYALGALLDLPQTQFQLPPSAAFPRLDPDHPRLARRIDVASTADAYARRFPDKPLTTGLMALQSDATYQHVQTMRNVFAHRTASGGRALDYSRTGLMPFHTSPDARPAVRLWGGTLSLDEETSSTTYQWLSTTVTALVAATAQLVRVELPNESTTLEQPADPEQIQQLGASSNDHYASQHTSPSDAEYPGAVTLAHAPTEALEPAHPRAEFTKALARWAGEHAIDREQHSWPGMVCGRQRTRGASGEWHLC